MSKNPVVHFEMPYKDGGRVSKFYQDAFGWKMQDAGELMGHYIVAQTAETDENNMNQVLGTINGGFYVWSQDKPNPSFVISVENLDKAMQDVKKAGGKIIGEPQDIPTVGLWVVFEDSEGNKASMLQASR